MTLAPKKWSADELERDRIDAIDIFRRERLEEPIDDYMAFFEDARSAVENLLETTVDLSRPQLDATALDLLTDPALFDAVRYLAGPPMSVDDLKIVADARLSPTALRRDPEMVRRVVDAIVIALDHNRFPWIIDDRPPTEAERAAAALASAALLATRRVETKRRNDSKNRQERLVIDRLVEDGFREVPARTIPTLAAAPELGEFCGEALFGGRKADLIIRLWDHRVLALECKVSNSSTNSIKRLNNDAAVKGTAWLEEFGRAQTVPAALLGGVFNRLNLEQAQERGLSIFWSHRLDELIEFIERTRTPS